MQFNSIEFLLAYLPAALLVFYCVRPAWRVSVLFISSLAFYLFSGGAVALILFGTTLVWGFAFAKALRGRRSRLLLAIACALPLLFLFVAKYLVFVTGVVGLPPPSSLLGLTLPAGISFYTFQVLSYFFDIYDGRERGDTRFVHYGAFVSFFPHFIAGPILRHSQLGSQLDRLAIAAKVKPQMMAGLRLLVVGLAYKTLFADFLSPLHERYVSGPETNSADAVFSVLTYAGIIYFDFWGYSLMALGIAKLFGIDLPRNFLEPYRSRSPREFWRRWHVTLSYWLRDYVYLRLGGNTNYARNILLVFLACGLWHGAGWNFLAWGAYHALAILAYHAVRPAWDRWPAALQTALTFAVVAAGWPLFYLDIGSYAQLMSAIGHLHFAVPSVYALGDWLQLGLAGLWVFGFSEDKYLFGDGARRWANPVLLGAVAATCVLFFSYSRTFIYFQF